MIIHRPEITSVGGKVTVSAGVEFETPVPGMPERLWFEFPKEYEDLITDRADAFLCMMLLLAMQYGEDIEVRGKVSPRLLAGINEYQRPFCMWFPWRFKPIHIECESLIPPNTENGRDIVMSAFSGGVDSFFTLWSHIPPNEPLEPARITHLLFIHGFDIRLEHPESYPLLRDSYSAMCDRLGIKLISCRTNCQEFGTRSNWGVYHGSALIGAAHAVGKRTGIFYVPASHSFNNLMPWGSDPGIDYLLSTDRTQVIHDGAGFRRTEKTEALAGWEETYDKLRVCAPNDSPVNCSECEKCLRTMMTLDILGVLEKYSTFRRPVTGSLIRSCRYFNESDFSFANEIIVYARSKKRWDIVANLSYAYVRSRVLQVLRFTRIKLTGAIKRYQAG